MPKVSRQTKAKIETAPGVTPASDLQAMQAELSKLLGGGIFFGSDEELRIRHLPLGIPVIDNFLNGGLAYNRVTLLFGPFSSGKSVLAAMAAGAAQRAGQSVAWIDAEKSWNAEWATLLGVDTTQVLITQPNTAEEGFNQALAFLKARVGLVVIDSLMALRPKAEFSGDAHEMMDNNPMGVHAKTIGRGLMDMMASNQGSLVIAINQIRQQIGVVYGNPETTPGGIAQHHVAWQEIRVSRGEWLLEDPNNKKSQRIGYRMRMRMEKNKQGAPFTECEIPFHFTGQFDELSGLVEMAIELGIIRAKPPMFYIGADEKFFGRGKLLAAVKERPELQEQIRAGISELPESDI